MRKTPTSPAPASALAAGVTRRCLLWAPVAAACSGVAGVAQARTTGEVAVGEVLRDVRMNGLLGPSRSLSSLRGKPLIINVWASWCGPCREEMGSLERLSRRFWDGALNVIGISTDDYRDRAETYLRRTGITFANFIDEKLVLENMLGADRLPLTVLVDAQGRVLAKYYGAKAWDSAESIAMIARHFRLKL